jgi:hypothetical protein
MDSSAAPAAPRTFLRRLLALLSLNQLAALLELFEIAQQWWPGNPDMYEILDYESTWELLDTAGHLAVFHKRQRVKFLQNNIIAFEDYAWGDGEIFVDYKCAPGVVVDRYREGDRWNILISLRSTKNKNDIEEFYIERTVKAGFVHREEWQQAEIRRRTRRLQMNVIFPQGRPCQQAVLTQRSHTRPTVLGPEHFRCLPDGRQLLTWETTHVCAYDIYTLKWHW